MKKLFTFLVLGLFLFSLPAFATPMPPVVECWMQVGEGEVFKWSPDITANGDDTFYLDPSMTMANMWDISLPQGGGGVTVDFDPAVSLAVAITNLTGGPQTFTFSVMSPVVPPITTSTYHGGSTAATLSDADGSGGATLGVSPTGQPMYRGYIDLMMGGGPVLDMLPPDVSSISVSTPYGVNIVSKTLGLSPSGPTILSGPAMANIVLEHQFELTSQDTATFNSNFVVVPIPEPATLCLFGLGSLLLRKRKS
jgi:hypothetical protein